MTPEHETRWRQRDIPFSGNTAYADEVPLEVLLEMLRLAYDILALESPDILLCHDWHEHDGFVQPGGKSSWSELRRFVLSTRALYDSRDYDHAVSIGIYPTDYSWYLRYNIDDEDENDYLTAWCELDFTAKDNHSLLGLLTAKWPGSIKIEKSASFFDRMHDSG